MIDPFDKLIEETREKYRLSWEKSMENYNNLCKQQDLDFKYAIKYGTFPPKITIERILVEAKTRKLKAEWSLEVLPDKVSYNEEAVKELSYIMMHPQVYKIIEDYKNQNTIQRFLWELKWGFIECLDNFRNWQGYMKGEDYCDFWEILNGEWSSYE
jgi:hypothetical protein